MTSKEQIWDEFLITNAIDENIDLKKQAINVLKELGVKLLPPYEENYGHTNIAGLDYEISDYWPPQWEYKRYDFITITTERYSCENIFDKIVFAFKCLPNWKVDRWHTQNRALLYYKRPENGEK